MNTDPALQDLRPIGRRALISVLQGTRLASSWERETPTDAPFAPDTGQR